jgi:hypothetical protein
MRLGDYFDWVLIITSADSVRPPALLKKRPAQGLRWASSYLEDPWGDGPLCCVLSGVISYWLKIRTRRKGSRP